MCRPGKPKSQSIEEYFECSNCVYGSYDAATAELMGEEEWECDCEQSPYYTGLSMSNTNERGTGCEFWRGYE